MHDVAIGLENRPGPWPRWVALWATSCDRPFEVVLIARKKVIVRVSCVFKDCVSSVLLIGDV